MSDRAVLNSIESPEDVKALKATELNALAREIRDELVNVISRRGGHLASNLGTVELTIALLRVFDCSRDRIVWDTGHQAYTYKLLTGRRLLFESLREFGGCCGFLNPDESPYDIIGAGHAGTAVSAALGLAVARDLDPENTQERVVAVVGDGALGAGVSLEGLNSIIENTNDFILVINDNKMSISPNVGALSRYLTRVISGKSYNRLKRAGRNALAQVPLVGDPLHKGLQRIEELTKSVLVPGVLFEELGLRYIGPLNGHDIAELTDTFRAVRELKEPLVLHVVTEKGRGYPHAEKAPEVFHSSGKFDVKTGDIASGGALSFSDGLGDSLAAIMRGRSDVVAITAGMTRGTGLQQVQESFPDRFFDVGIAEEHAVVFAAGMAAAGWRPVVAVYATFMQRAMDYVFHDVALQKLPVIFALDRSGVVTDGPTHHGVHDISFWQTVPGISVTQPSDQSELDMMLRSALERDQATILRYPKGSASAAIPYEHAEIRWGVAEVFREGTDVSIWGVGRESVTALALSEAMEKKGYSVKVVNPRFIIPFDRDMLLQDATTMPLVTLEDHCTAGGFASITACTLEQAAGVYPVLHRGWPTEVLPWGQEAKIREQYRLNVPQLCDDIVSFLGSETSSD